MQRDLHQIAIAVGKAEYGHSIRRVQAPQSSL